MGTQMEWIACEGLPYVGVLLERLLAAVQSDALVLPHKRA